MRQILKNRIFFATEVAQNYCNEVPNKTLSTTARPENHLSRHKESNGHMTHDVWFQTI